MGACGARMLVGVCAVPVVLVCAVPVLFPGGWCVGVVRVPCRVVCCGVGSHGW